MNQDSRSAVRAYYELGWEKDRLTTGKGHAAAIEGDVERIRTLQLMNRYLPKNKATIVDVGGGAGAYSFYLAGLGHDMHLIDLMPLHIEQARAEQEKLSSPKLASCKVGDACQLDFPDHFADVVLCMGPLYHLPDEEERKQCLKEIYRVLKKGGLLFAVGISRFVSLLEFLRSGSFIDAARSAMVQRDLASGKHENPSGNPMLFTTAYFHNPEELQREVKDAGFANVNTMAIEGPLLFTKDLETHWKDPASKELLLSFVEQIEQEQAILGMSNHLAVVGYKLCI